MVAKIGHHNIDPNIPNSIWYDVLASSPSSVLSPKTLPMAICQPMHNIRIGKNRINGTNLRRFRMLPDRENPLRPLQFELMSLPSKFSSASLSPILVAIS